VINIPGEMKPESDVRALQVEALELVSTALQNTIRLLRNWRGHTKVTVQGIREGMDSLAAGMPVPKDVKVETVDAGGVPAEWISTPGVNQHNIIIHYHGGGFVAGSAKNTRVYLGRLSRASKARVLSVDYRLAPEHPYPAAVDDAFEAYKWFLSKKLPSSRIIIEGESAGGNLAAVTLIKARDAKLPLPLAAILISPPMNFAERGGSFISKTAEDPFLSPRFGDLFRTSYIGTADIHRDPMVSPIYADLTGLPPFFIQVGSAEILLDQSTYFAAKAKNAGVKVELDVIEGGFHCLALFPPIIPEVKQAMRKITMFVTPFFSRKNLDIDFRKII